MMKAAVFVLIFGAVATEGFLFGGEKWDDLKVTWGVNPLNSYHSMPRTVKDADAAGWKLEKSCGEVNGDRYILEDDPAVLLVFNAEGNIGGIATKVPKGLDFPAGESAKYFQDEGDEYYTMTVYFQDPKTVCTGARRSKRLATGDALVISQDKVYMTVPLDESDMEFNKEWTKGGCFYTMGRHYWLSGAGGVKEDTKADELAPIFLLYNEGQLNGFGFVLNANLESPRYEHPPKEALGVFFANGTPKFLSEAAKSSGLTTMHVYLDSTPLLNFC
ncbi:Hypp1602 [Branchiostoma lanceolatum]|uniref:Hypp1602 protein n=1 Tax=Branchiostoma lanceolatum TaxID=7740 RepID=A0A8J9ZLD5_BRALA|nr:Hypp1602 [Branchiostoma lanceolatum]